MAKLMVEMDSETKVLKVVANGVEMKDVDSVSIYRGYENEFGIRVSTRTMDKNTDTCISTDYWMTCEKEEASMAQASEIPGFSKKPGMTQVQRDIQDFLKGKK